MSMEMVFVAMHAAYTDPTPESKGNRAFDREIVERNDQIWISNFVIRISNFEFRIFSAIPHPFRFEIVWKMAVIMR